MSNLSKKVTIRLTSEDYDRFINKVIISGYNQSVYARNALLGDKVTIIAKDNIKELLRQINMMGNNINQLAYRVNLDNINGKTSNDTYKSILKGLLAIESKLDALVALNLYSKRKDIES
jgi:hypothetical protein